MSDDISVRYKPLSGVWQTLPMVPESLVMSSNMWGSDRCTFDVHHDPSITTPYLNALCPLDVWIGGMLVWSGRILQTPTRYDAEPVIAVEAQGWQYHLEDYPFRRVYVHSNMTDYKDARDFLGQNLLASTNGYIAAGQVQAGDSGIMLAFPKDTIFAAGTAGVKAGVTLDLGSGLGVAKRVVIDWDTSNNDGTNTKLLVRGYDTENTTTSPDANGISVNNNATPTLTGVTFNTSRRYVAIQLENQTASRTLTDDVWFRIKTARVFSATAYESAGASVLKASDVVADALTQGSVMLSTDTSQISATTFNIPELAATSFTTAKDLIEGVNAFHGYITKIDAEGRMVFKPRPTTPKFRLAAGRYSFSDASTNSAANIYSSVVVVGTGPDGIGLAVERTQAIPLFTGINASFVRRKILEVSAAVTTSAANQVGDTFLSLHQTNPLQGSITVTGQNVVQAFGGGMIHPAGALQQTGELVKIDDLVDPDTGGIGRVGTITGVTYTHDTREVQLDLDNTDSTFEALLAQYALLVGH